VPILKITQDLRHLSDVLDSIQDKIERIGADVLEVRNALAHLNSGWLTQTQITGLKSSLERLSSLPEVPFDDEYELVRRAGRIHAMWKGVLVE
jgi:hypothetical protein